MPLPLTKPRILPSLPCLDPGRSRAWARTDSEAEGSVTSGGGRNLSSHPQERRVQTGVPLRVAEGDANGTSQPLLWGPGLIPGSPRSPCLLQPPALRLGLDTPGPVLGSKQVPPSISPAPPLPPNSLPPGTHLLLGKLIHYSLKALFLAGSKLPALHFAATT